MLSKFRRITLNVNIEYLPTKEGIPVFLPKVIDYLKRNLESEGIFRKQGNKKIVYELDEAISQHVPYIPENAHVDEVASFLKLWLSKLPEPLICPDTIALYNASDITTSTVDILSHIPTVNRHCVAMIFSLIDGVIKHSDKNLMTYKNLEASFFYSFTQESANFPSDFRFKAFFYKACTLINNDGTDFNLFINSNSIPLLRAKARRNYRTCEAALKLRKLSTADVASINLDSEEFRKELESQV